ncbi:MAG: HNH endonuclease [Lachnospiraceae bacterium]|nr:HNH endonuclease [Lachnospiraceae bacterium]
MEDLLPMQGMPRLIDAHSFVWVIQEDRFINWVPDPERSVQIEQTVEEYIQGVISGSGGRRSVTSSTFVRSAEVVKETRRRANGICQLCNQPAPFIDKKGNPYLEVHHIIWLSRGGEDNTGNTAALCPNCHTRMYVLDKPEDVEKLKSVIGCNKG